MRRTDGPANCASMGGMPRARSGGGRSSPCHPRRASDRADLVKGLGLAHRSDDDDVDDDDDAIATLRRAPPTPWRPPGHVQRRDRRQQQAAGRVQTAAGSTGSSARGRVGGGQYGGGGTSASGPSSARATSCVAARVASSARASADLLLVVCLAFGQGAAVRLATLLRDGQSRRAGAAPALVARGDAGPAGARRARHARHAEPAPGHLRAPPPDGLDSSLHDRVRPPGRPRGTRREGHPLRRP
eukprot:scaffold873_cov393-Prasinococcus_capsulatus_cf.AAC.29